MAIWIHGDVQKLFEGRVCVFVMEGHGCKRI